MGGRCTHTNGPAKVSSCRQIVCNEQCSNEGGAGGASRTEVTGVGATRRSPHHDGANNIGVSLWKVAHHQGSTFGKQVFFHQWQCGFSPKGNRISRIPRVIINTGVNTLSGKLVRVENKEMRSSIRIFKLWVNVHTFWAKINSGDTAGVDLEAPRAILLPEISDAYVMEEPRTVHD